MIRRFFITILGVLVFCSVSSAMADIWSFAGLMNTLRYCHTSILLPNGEVLVAGGHDGEVNFTVFSSAELYNPNTEKWATIESMNVPRYNHTATLLPNGQVLVAGGSNSNTASATLASAELYSANSTTGKWIATESMKIERQCHTATLLPNGQVLVVGGYNSSGDVVTNAEIYDPDTGSWKKSANPMKNARYSHTATLLPNGQVLVVGGSNGSYLNSAEIYNPISDTWVKVESMKTARYLHTATLMPNGQVLVAGGIYTFNSFTLASAELYNPDAGTWSYTGSMNIARRSQTATLLRNGQVLVAGGSVVDKYNKKGEGLNSTELYNYTTGTWSVAGGMNVARYLHSATLLLSGRVLVDGGINNNNLVDITELYTMATSQPSSSSSDSSSRAGLDSSSGLLSESSSTPYLDSSSSSNVTPEAEVKPAGLSTGAIIGIVASSGTVVAATAGIIIYRYKNKKHNGYDRIAEG